MLAFLRGKATDRKLRLTRRGMSRVKKEEQVITEALRRRKLIKAHDFAGWLAVWDEVFESIAAAEEVVAAGQAAVLRDISGPLPFRPVTISPDVRAWNDRLVVRLAKAIYDARRWGDMPLLGDALLDAGCDNEEVLAHCRAGGEHVRGCWVVDLLLGKS
jgi:hypothetical protein